MTTGKSRLLVSPCVFAVPRALHPGDSQSRGLRACRHRAKGFMISKRTAAILAAWALWLLAVLLLTAHDETPDNGDRGLFNQGERSIAEP
jgi:hypothetical protein